MAKKKNSGLDSMKKNARVLCLLSKTSPKVIKAVISSSNNDLIKTISACSSNVLSGKYFLEQSEIDKLKKHKKALRNLSEKHTSVEDKRALLMKGGSLLPILIGTIAPILLDTFLKLTRKKN